MLGLTLLNQGELKAARSVLERALDDAVSQRDGDTQFLFDWDTDGEASAAAYLALTEWHLGEPQRARQLIQRAIRRADQLGHVATLANVLFFRTVLESRRDDAFATQRATEDLLRLTEEHGIKSFADMVQMYVNWSHGRLVDPEAGALAINRGLAAHLADGNKGAALTYYVLLAELEATTLDLDHALTLIGERLAIAEEIGGHFSAHISIVCAATSVCVAIRQTPPRRRKRSRPPSRSPISRARAVMACAQPFARQALSIDRPSDRRPRRTRAGARRFCADAGDARDRWGAGAAGGYRGRRASDARMNTAMSWPSCHSE